MMFAELIARLEAAAEGSAELDAQVIAAIVGAEAAESPINGRWCVYSGSDRNGQRRLYESRDPWWGAMRRALVDGRGPTRSLDAAMTLVPSELDWIVRTDQKRGGFANVTNDYASRLAIIPGAPERRDPNAHPSFAATPALALCIAALKARSALGANTSERGTA